MSAVYLCSCSLQLTSAPCCSSSLHMSALPLYAACMRGVMPYWRRNGKKSIIQQSIYHNLNINDGFPMVTLTTPKNTQSINQWRLHFQLIFCSFKSSFSISSSKYTHILLWCLYYLFRLSFWWHPFTEVDLWIVSISPNRLRWRINLIYVLDGLRVSKCSAIFHF